MTELPRLDLDYGKPTTPKAGPRFAITGAWMMGAGVVMAVIGASFFSMSTVPPPVIYWIGMICFFGCLPVGAAGVVLLIVGLAKVAGR